MPQLFEQFRLRNPSFQLRLARVVVLHLRPLFDIEAEADFESQQPQQTDRVVVQGVVGNGSELFAIEISHTVIWIEQQPARRRIQGERDGVDGEVAAA